MAPTYLWVLASGNPTGSHRDKKKGPFLALAEEGEDNHCEYAQNVLHNNACAPGSYLIWDKIISPLIFLPHLSGRAKVRNICEPYSKDLQRES